MSQPTGALDMNRKIAVAKAEPVLAAERGKGLHERPGFVLPAPTEFCIVEAGKRVHERVGVRRDMQAEMLEIIANIGDDDEIFGLDDPAQAQRELGAADAAGERDDKIPTHRNRSSLEGRMTAAAVDSGADQRKPRIRTTGDASSAWPITSEAAAAISSAKPMMLASSLRPKRSGRPRRSIKPGRPAAPIATPVVPWRHARPKLSFITTARSIAVAAARPVLSAAALRSGSSGNRSARCPPSPGSTFDWSTPAFAMMKPSLCSTISTPRRA